MPAVLSIVAGYLLGSISSSCIAVRLFGKEDLRGERDGRISAATVYYKLGAFPYALATLSDIALGFFAVALARTITGSLSIAMLAGLAAMAGHNWSPFLRFKGGQGATTMAGAMLAVMPVPLLYGLAAAGLFRLFSRRGGVGTGVGIFAIFIVALIQNGPGTLAVYPISLFSLMIIKRLQLARSSVHDMAGYKK